MLDTTRVAQREIKKLYKAAENDIKLAARDGMCTICEWLKTAKLCEEADYECAACKEIGCKCRTCHYINNDHFSWRGLRYDD